MQHIYKEVCVYMYKVKLTHLLIFLNHLLIFLKHNVTCALKYMYNRKVAQFTSIK